MLRQLHEATRDLALPPGTEWRSGTVGKEPGQVIRHGDLGPWNTLWHGDTLTGLIDWDFAEPGAAITDLAQMALYWAPLRGEAHWRECGFPERPDFRRRLDALCAAYGDVELGAVVREVKRLQQASMTEIAERAAEGRYPWTMFQDNGEIAKTQAEIDWLQVTFPEVACS
jgi:aminoglycoside phosphotransferase (APT) family kinase protein